MKNKSKKPFSCDFVECVATSNLVVETNRGSFDVKKGSSVFVSINESGKAVILRKGIKKEGKSVSLNDFYVEIKDDKLFKDFLSEAVVLAEEVKNTMKEVNISKLNSLIVSESLKIEEVVPFLIKNNLVKEKENKKVVFLPVKEKVKTLSFSQRAGKFESVKAIAKSSDAIKSEMKGIKYETSFVSEGYIVNSRKIIEEFNDEQPVAVSPEDSNATSPETDNPLKTFILSSLPEKLDPKFSFVDEGNLLKFSAEGADIGSIELTADGYTLKDVVNEVLLNEVLQVVMSLIGEFGTNASSTPTNDVYEEANEGSVSDMSDSDKKKYHDLEKQKAKALDSGDTDKYLDFINKMNSIRNSYKIKPLKTPKKEEMVIKKGDAEITFRDSDKPESDTGPEQNVSGDDSDNDKEEDKAKNLKLSSDEYMEL